jgi:hypothetical protein
VTTRRWRAVAMTDAALVPVYSIYDRSIPAEHARVASFRNPIGLEIIDGRKDEHKSVASCQGDRCRLQSREDERDG